MPREDLEPDLGRLTDTLNPNHHNCDTTAPVLTANPTIWYDPEIAVPTFWNDTTLKVKGCTALNNPLLGETDSIYGWKLMHPSSRYRAQVAPSAGYDDFENIARNPHFGRTAIYYDGLPANVGPVWGRLPAPAKWDSIAPRGEVRNQLGKEAAIAYREHGGEPWHYVVLSYDERGRIEAMLRYTENLGFDAVYYRYNSLNQVIAVRTADPLNLHESYYGTDHNGRVDSIWTVFAAKGHTLSASRSDSTLQHL